MTIALRHNPAEQVTAERWAELKTLKYGPPDKRGWGPRLREKFHYHTPDDWYEAAVFDLVTSESVWLDVGCGRDLFPSNPAAARVLASRCRLLVGLDPSDNIDENPFVHQKAKCQLEDFRTDIKFDLITLRMVAEHIRSPQEVARVLSRLVKPGGRVVIYTVSKWSPASLVAAATPMKVHHFAKSLLWGTNEQDTFPTAFKMNTRRVLKKLFADVGMAEESFQLLDDCRSFQRWKISNFLELCGCKILNSVGLHYPEACILAVYRNKS